MRVTNPAAPDRHFSERFWVDTGALYSSIPEDKLDGIGPEAIRTREVILADGRTECGRLGEAKLTIDRWVRRVAARGPRSSSSPPTRSVSGRVALAGSSRVRSAHADGMDDRIEEERDTAHNARARERPKVSTTSHLRIQNFAHLADVEITLGDLTVLVGAQGTGKSLALQWLKTALDGKRIVKALGDAGHDVGNSASLVDLIFGVGMGNAWRAETSVAFDKRVLKPSNLAKLGGDAERVFFIPAHRAMLISDGWAAPFQKLNAQTPVVARLFSQNLFDLFSPQPVGEPLFPMERKLKTQVRTLIDDAVFHGGSVGLDLDDQHARRLKLTHGDKTVLPFMTWSAGQREFTPLLLGLYHLLPERKFKKQENIDWVVVEEPEMGLHPEAMVAFMLLVLDLLWRNYRVVLATHSPLVLTVVWMLRRLVENKARWQLVCEGFDIPARGYQALRNVASAALEKSYKTHLLQFDGKVIRSKDISDLDPGADDEDVAGWGGLTGFSSRFAETVRKSVAEAG